MPLDFTSEKQKVKNKKLAEKLYVRYFLVAVAVFSGFAAFSFGILWPIAFTVVTIPFIVWNEIDSSDNE
jgi:hypothetical protein